MVAVRQLNRLKDQKYLATVGQLWRSHSATLGFFTAGAFEEYASKGQILIAIDHTDQCIGYLLYRTSREAAVIVHLCVSSEHQGFGVAKTLVDSLKANTRELRGIRLSCRRDFDVSRIWPKFGFVALSDRPGRNLDGKPLTTWWFDHGHPTLFTQYADTTKISVVIDANVFFDFDAVDDPDIEESKALAADWVQANIELYVTPEILNEIDRQPNPVVREQERKRARSFEWIRSDHAEYNHLKQSVENLFQKPFSLQDESDIRQISHALAGDAQFFITRDAALLELSDSIYEKFGLTILRPSDLIVHLDSLEGETDYLPVRLAGTGCSCRLVKVGELDSLISSFQQTSARETATELRRKLTVFLSDPRRYSCYVVLSSDSEKLSLYAKCEATNGAVDIPLFRVKDFSLGKTLARFLATTIHLRESSGNPTITRVTELFLPPFVETALIETGYVCSDNCWLKVGIPAIGTSDKFVETLAKLAMKFDSERKIFDDIANKLKVSAKIGDHIAGADIERALWPAKITDLSISNYIVPIQPVWAKDLFDEHLAREDLFGAKLDLALQQEGVYYRKNHFGMPRAPGRLLWYVSHRAGYQGSGYVRACSRLDEVLIGKPKELYRKFRRLGIYEWENVYETAGGNVESNIMVLRFSHTELLPTPISWVNLQQILKLRNIKTNIRSPVAIDVETFTELYQIGKKNAKLA